MGMMERCMEAASGMGMAGGGMGVMLLIAAFVVFVWVLGLAAVMGLGIWGVRRLSTNAGS
jgi:hypothetical protein